MNAKCRSCGAPIQWALTTSHKRLAVNVEPSREYGTMELRGGYVKPLSGAQLIEARLAGKTLYISHSADCPQYAPTVKQRS